MLVNWELLFFFPILFPFSCFFFKIKKCKIWNVNSLQALSKQERRENPIEHWTEDYRKGKYWFFSCKPFTYSHCVVLLCMFALRHIEFTLTLKLYGVFTPCFLFCFVFIGKVQQWLVARGYFGYSPRTDNQTFWKKKEVGSLE